jgi:hypothetical protein
VQRRGTSCTGAFSDIKHLARSMPADGLEAQDIVPPRCGRWGCPHGPFSSRRSVFLGKLRTLAPALSRCCACNHLEIAVVTVMAGLWSVAAEAVVRACLTSIGIVRVLLRRLGLPRALCERGYRPSDRGHRRQRPAISAFRGQILCTRQLIIGNQGRSPFSRKIHAEIHCWQWS